MGSKLRAKDRKTLGVVELLPTRERAKVKAALRTLCRPKTGPRAALEAGEDIITAYNRLIAKRESDAHTDAVRRVLVGARVPRSLADQCKAAAAAEGVSLYSWVTAALAMALVQARIEGDYDGGPQLPELDLQEQKAARLEAARAVKETGGQHYA